MTQQVLLDFVGHTDFAGAIRARSGSPGAAMLAAYFDHFRRQNPGGTVVLDAGDLGAGPPSFPGATAVVGVLNRLGYDAVTLGNHELDRGPDDARRALSGATFPLLCANIVQRDTGELLDFARPYVVIERSGVRIGIIGLTTAYTPFMMLREAFDTIEIRDPVAVAKELVAHLRDTERVDVVVANTHFPGRILDDGSYEGELFEFATAVEGIDVVFGGHNPGDIAHVREGTSINKTGFARAIGHVRVAVDREAGTVTPVLNEIVEMAPNSLRLPPDAAITATVEEAMAPWAEMLDEVLATADSELAVPYRGEFSLGDFFTDCMRDACGTRVALMNSTSCYGSIPPGPITAEDIVWLTSFNDALNRGTMTGAQLLDIWELTYDDDHRALNGDLQVSGLNVTVDTRGRRGQRVVSVMLDDGTPIDPAASYTVATSDYLADGGNGYGALFADTTVGADGPADPRCLLRAAPRQAPHSRRRRSPR